MSYLWGMGNDWKNLPSTAHIDRQTNIVALIYKMATNVLPLVAP